MKKSCKDSNLPLASLNVHETKEMKSYCDRLFWAGCGGVREGVFLRHLDWATVEY